MPTNGMVVHMSPEQAAETMALWEECGDAREFACRVLAAVMNAYMDEQAQEMCGAARNQRGEGRTNSRNGYRPRTLVSSLGEHRLEIPKLRSGSYFPEGMLERWSRVDASVALVVQEMYAVGVSTRKVSRVAERLGIPSLSASEASRLCAGLDEEVAELRGRDLSGTPCCYVWLDATYMRCREGSSVVSKGVVTAIGLGADGRKHLLGAGVVDTESEGSWARFLRGLRQRGLSGVRLVVSDDHPGLVAAISEVFQGCAWQRCLAHLQRNLRSAMAGGPEEAKRAVSELVHAAAYQDDPDLGRYVWEEAEPLVDSLSAGAGELFAAAEDSALAFYAFPGKHWPKIRTNNVQERENREIKRRYRVVQSFPSVASMVRLTCAVVLEDEGRWAQQRVFSEESAAEGFKGARDRPAPTPERRRALERRAGQIVREIAERHGLELPGVEKE